ncbi:MAG: hypothetical protein FJX46_16135 [Alphaproteobacteria bacterium]|nr:hypothetical protein [Alphaproteobacteria bacterium]
MASAPSRLTCANCGRVYVCDPGGDCWCMHVTVRLPVPADPAATCLCPCELERLARAAREARP